MNCLHCDPDPNGAKQCMILCASMCYSPGDEKYPKEWVYDENDNHMVSVLFIQTSRETYTNLMEKLQPSS